MSRPVLCCEHDPCPDRPRHLLDLFQVRPWVCPQCHTSWVTEFVISYPVPNGEWKWLSLGEVQRPPA